MRAWPTESLSGKHVREHYCRLTLYLARRTGVPLYRLVPEPYQLLLLAGVLDATQRTLTKITLHYHTSGTTRATTFSGHYDKINLPSHKLEAMHSSTRSSLPQKELRDSSIWKQTAHERSSARGRFGSRELRFFGAKGPSLIGYLPALMANGGSAFSSIEIGQQIIRQSDYIHTETDHDYRSNISD